MRGLLRVGLILSFGFCVGLFLGLKVAFGREIGLGGGLLLG